MKRILLLVVCFFSIIIIIVQLANELSVNEDISLEGHLVTVEGSLYLVSDEAFNSEAADGLTRDDIMTFKHIYRLDHMPFSFKTIDNGDEVKVYHSGNILESHPAQVSVLKIEKKEKLITVQ